MVTTVFLRSFVFLLLFVYLFGPTEATSNIQFIDQHINSDPHIPGQKLHLTTTVSSGAIFSDSFLDSLLSTVSTSDSVTSCLINSQSLGRGQLIKEHSHCHMG